MKKYITLTGAIMLGSVVATDVDSKKVSVLKDKLEDIDEELHAIKNELLAIKNGKRSSSYDDLNVERRWGGAIHHGIEGAQTGVDIYQ
jgi:hypothetical protein